MLYVDDAVGDATPFGDVRQRAFTIMPRDALQIAGQRLSGKPASKLALRWHVIDEFAERIRRHLRPLYGAIGFSSATPDNPRLAALAWMKGVFAKQQRLSIESYHQLRSAIAQAGGKKEPTGRTDIKAEISNQCARLIANAIIYYNSAILSRLLAKYEASQDAKALALIKKVSPPAWRHVHLNGYYTFRSNGQVIDLDAIVAGLDLA